MKYLIVGLGNIGPEYLLTRHNVGFMTLDRLTSSFETKFSTERLAYHAEIKHKGKQIHFIKPTTFMNLSGKAVNYWMKELKIEKKNILIITDDIALRCPCSVYCSVYSGGTCILVSSAGTMADKSVG